MVHGEQLTDAGSYDGLMEMSWGVGSLIHGGGRKSTANEVAAKKQGVRPAAHLLTPTTVPVVDVTSWIERSFKRSDFVVMKIDVEGAEHDVLDALIGNGTLSSHIDLLAWEAS